MVYLSQSVNVRLFKFSNSKVKIELRLVSCGRLGIFSELLWWILLQVVMKNGESLFKVTAFPEQRHVFVCPQSLIEARRQISISEALGCYVYQ